MKVKELVEALLLEDQEAFIVMSSDSEGNSYISGCEIYAEYSVDINNESYYIDYVTDKESLLDEGFEEDQLVPIVVLYP
jgi:hypothetical protein